MVHSHLHVSRRQTFFFKEPIRKGNTKRGEWLDRIRFSGEHKTFFRRIPIFRLVSYPRILLVMAYQSSMIKYKFPCLNNIRSESNFLPNWAIYFTENIFSKNLKKSGPFFFACFWHTKYTLYGLTHKWITLSCIFDSTSFLSENELSHLPDPAYIPIYLFSKTCLELQLSCFSSSQY